MATYIRLTDYKSSEEKERGFFDPKNRYEAKQEDFFKISGAPIAYWVSDRVKEIFEKSKKLGEIAEPKNGMSTTNNEKFLRFWFEVDFSKIGFNFSNRIEAKESGLKWFPYNKGGGYRKWYGNIDYVLNYYNDGEELKKFVINNPKDPKTAHWSRRLFNTKYFYKESISFSSVTSGELSLRYYPEGFIFDSAGSSIFLTSNFRNYVLGLLNAKFINYLLKILNSTISILTSDIKSLPIIFPKSESTKQKIDQLTQECIEISKEEWDSRETSWDFEASPLLMDNGELRIENRKIEDAYNAYCNYWREKFYKLHSNEEELNRLFIEIYGLEDELTPNVDLKDITILKNEAKIVDNELIFDKKEIIKQLISYGVGVIFGRYSLDHKGLHIANMDESLDEANSKFNIQNPKFQADDDNIIPVLEDEYFADDIVSRFIQFIKAAFGEENLNENIRFIEDALGKDLRKYFLKDFYEDHIKRYKKRPIYWMVSSSKRSFNALFYMHRYKDDLFARIQNSYLREYIAKLEAAVNDEKIKLNSDSISNAERKRTLKNIDKINKKIDELIKFDRDKLSEFAVKKIKIDLDDGVKVNYCKFKDILYPIKGLCKN